MDLYKEDGTQAGIYDVIEWFNETYPPDIFVSHPIAIVRDMLNKLVANKSKKKL